MIIRHTCNMPSSRRLKKLHKVSYTWNAGKTFTPWKRIILIYASKADAKRTPYYYYYFFLSGFFISCVFYNYDDQFYMFFLSLTFLIYRISYIHIHVFRYFINARSRSSLYIFKNFQAFLSSTSELVCITATLLSGFKYCPAVKITVIRSPSYNLGVFFRCL